MLTDPESGKNLLPVPIRNLSLHPCIGGLGGQGERNKEEIEGGRVRGREIVRGREGEEGGEIGRERERALCDLFNNVINPIPEGCILRTSLLLITSPITSLPGLEQSPA